MWDALQGANYVFVVVTVLMTVLGLFGRALRWQLLFYPTKGLPLSKVFAVLNIGYLLMNVLPARLGDVARAILLGELTGVSKARALSTIVVERVTDVLVVLLFLASVVFFVPVPEWVCSRPCWWAWGSLAWRLSWWSLPASASAAWRCCTGWRAWRPFWIGRVSGGWSTRCWTGWTFCVTGVRLVSSCLALSSSGFLASSSSIPSPWPLT